MTHQWHDAYRHQRTPAHHLDPRSKLFAGFLFIGIVLFTPRFNSLQALGYPLLLVTAASLARIPIRSLVTRVAVVLPFAALMLVSLWVSHRSFAYSLHVLGKALLSLGAMSLVALTTPFPDVLRAMHQSRLPRIFVLFVAFLYRYGAVLQQEGVQVERAWQSRYFGKYRTRQATHMGHVIASLFIRSYERAERVYAAMQSRGFSTQSPTVSLLHYGGGDIAFILAVGVLLTFFRWGRG